MYILVFFLGSKYTLIGIYIWKYILLIMLYLSIYVFIYTIINNKILKFSVQCAICDYLWVIVNEFITLIKICLYIYKICDGYFW